DGDRDRLGILALSVLHRAAFQRLSAVSGDFVIIDTHAGCSERFFDALNKNDMKICCFGTKM
ncbi:MAG: hypothetical protein II082_02755, partial [Ruminococcus sp.]|nr:hypothetical protein [Ruminococcus sp.]